MCVPKRRALLIIYKEITGKFGHKRENRKSCKFILHNKVACDNIHTT